MAPSVILSAKSDTDFLISNIYVHNQKTLCIQTISTNVTMSDMGPEGQAINVFLRF